MNQQAASIINRADLAVEFVREKLGNHWVVGVPLGLGKPNHLVNALYRAAKNDPGIKLELYTALSLNPPKKASGLKQRFLGPFLQRQFGDYPRLEYLQDLDRKQVPANIQISEFYFRSGTRMRDQHAQQHYLSSNYTHVARDMQSRGVNLLLQMVACDPNRPEHFSLSCNPDVTLDLLKRIPREKLLVLLQVNEDLPYMEGDAEIRREVADLVLEGEQQTLFAVPRMPVNDQDMLIGLHASQLIRDGGTLQLGIGSLGDAVSFCSLLRHQNNDDYLELVEATKSVWRTPPELVSTFGGTDTFGKGLYAASEMFTEGFLHLYKGGILKRRVYDWVGLQQLLNQGLIDTELKTNSLDVLWQHGLLPKTLDESSLQQLHHFGIFREGVSLNGSEVQLPDGSSISNDLSDSNQRQQLASKALGKRLDNGTLLHAAFFLGSHWMYQQLRDMPSHERKLFQMTAVSRVNQLYRGEEMDRAQRLDGRFINTTMKMTLLGAAVSDQLDQGQVVSGVGGQYNFVAMAHALDGARSILMLRSHRGHGHKAVSNIVWEFPHTTIPRHLRDIVITEYGVADLRSAKDHEVIQSLICIADSRWQETLRQSAAQAGKLDEAWSIPAAFCSNTPESTRQCLLPFRQRGLISQYPFGSDFTVEEEAIAAALAYLQQHTQGRWNKLRLLFQSLGPKGKEQQNMRPYLDRMGFDSSTSWKEILEKRLLCLAIKSTGCC